MCTIYVQFSDDRVEIWFRDNMEFFPSLLEPWRDRDIVTRVIHAWHDYRENSERNSDNTRTMRNTIPQVVSTMHRNNAAEPDCYAKSMHEYAVANSSKMIVLREVVCWREAEDFPKGRRLTLDKALRIQA